MQKKMYVCICVYRCVRNANKTALFYDDLQQG